MKSLERYGDMRTQLEIVRTKITPSSWDIFLYQNYIIAESIEDDVTRFNILDKIVQLRKDDYKLTMEIP